MNTNGIVSRSCLAVTVALGLCACQTTPVKTDISTQEPRWFNPTVFDGVESIGTSPYDLRFEVEFYGVDSKVFSIRNCSDIAVMGDGKIAEREFVRWDYLKVNCEAANRFHLAPDMAISYWPNTFDYPLLKILPATATPYLGGQGLDGRTGNLGDAEATLTVLGTGEHSVKVSYGSMVVDYVVVARGDLNRDGYQDIFVRMDWYVEDGFGDGSDWAVFTKLFPDAAPLMLWRK